MSGLHGKAAFRVMVIFAVVKCGHVRTDKTVPVRVAMSSDLKTVQVSRYSASRLLKVSDCHQVLIVGMVFSKTRTMKILTLLSNVGR